MRQHSNLQTLLALKGDAHTTGVKNGADLDIRSYEGDLLFLCSLDDIGSAGTITYKVQTAPDNGSGAAGTYADVTDGALPAMTAVGQKRIHVNRRALKEWARIVGTVAVETVDACAFAVIMEPKQDLVAAPDLRVGY